MTGNGESRLVPGLLLALVLAVVLAPNPGTFTNADSPKLAVLIFGGGALLLLVLARALRSKAEVKVAIPETLSLLSLAVIAGFVAAPRAPDAGLTILALAEIGTLSAVGILATRFLATDSGVRAVSAAFLSAAVVGAAFGLVGWPAGRASLFGNPSFAAELVAGALPLAFVFARSRGRWAAAAAAILGLAFLVVAKSRADWLGVLAGAAVLAALTWLARRPRPGSPALLAGGLLAVILALPFAIDALPLPVLGRSDTVEVRSHIRDATIEMGLRHPVTGVGLGGFRAAYPEYRHPEEVTLSLGREVTFAHHLPSAVLAETGVPGLVALLAFLFFVLWGAIRTALARAGDRFAPAAAGALVAILVSAQFSAPLRHPGSAVLFFVLVGLVAARRPRRFVTHLKGRYRRAVPVLLLLVPAVVGAILLPSRLEADRLYRTAVDLEREGAGAMDEQVARLLERSVAATPTPEAYRQLALWLTLTDRADESLARLDRLFAISPRDEAGREERARALLSLGQTEDALPILEELARRRPEEDTVKLLLGLARLGSGRPGAFLPELFQALRTMPLESVRGAARTIARNLDPASWDGFAATVSSWPDAERALRVLAVFGDGFGEFYGAVVLTREGRLDAAMSALRAAKGTRAMAGRDPTLDPRFAPLRDRADFHAAFDR